ncbi:glycosyltransferase [Streptomyces sp. NPDC021080]|uniref:glycosyltransferase n=1 Tax=Streptomyces sp. NPDC021080 TaxID=3365110 RepID=UPI0037895684
MVDHQVDMFEQRLLGHRWHHHGPLSGQVCESVGPPARRDLRDGVTGILLDTSSAAGFESGLRRIAALPERDRERFARAGRDLVTARYSIDVIANALAWQYGAARKADQP